MTSQAFFFFNLFLCGLFECLVGYRHDDTAWVISVLPRVEDALPVLHRDHTVSVLNSGTTPVSAGQRLADNAARAADTKVSLCLQGTWQNIDWDGMKYQQ